MSQIHAEVSAVVDAPPEAVYAVIADYHKGHPAILPRPYFQELVVEQGGQGAGTVVRVRMKVMGLERTFRPVVSEPQPGRVLVEADEAAGLVTTFTVTPLDGGRHSRVTISTDARPSPGFQGQMERWVNPILMRRIYREELNQLAAYLAGVPA